VADYFSIKELLADTDNMEIIRNNSGNDSGTDTVRGVSWFKYNGVVAGNIYVNGNSWMGIGTNAEQLKVCRRDAMSWTVRREEGTIYNYYKFLRVRWEGYAQYHLTTAEARLVWDMLLLDTGDIVVHFDAIPTNPSYMGESALVMSSSSISFTPTAGGYVYFLHQDADGLVFVKSDEPIVLLDPYNRRYLITDASGDLYTEEDGALLKLNETELTAEVFETYGIQDVPDGSLLLGLTDPTILYWHDSDNPFPPFTTSITGIPKPQIVYSENIDMSDASILGIEKVIADCDDAVIFAVSFDNGETWWAYINDAWGQLSEEDSGMSKAAIESISADAWSQKAVTGQLKYRFVISGADGYIRSVTTDYLNREE